MLRGEYATIYAAMNSFHFCTIYRSSVITEFQQAIRLMRSVNDPPSRTAPAFSMTLPSGLRISFCAGLPSIQ